MRAVPENGLVYMQKTANSQGQHFDLAEEAQPPVSNILFSLAWGKGWMLEVELLVMSYAAF